MFGFVLLMMYLLHNSVQGSARGKGHTRSFLLGGLISGESCHTFLRLSVQFLFASLATLMIDFVGFCLE